MSNQATLDEKIEYLKINSKPFDSTRVGDSIVTIVTRACERAGFEVREDNFHGGPEAAQASGRLGLSVYSEKNDPLIYLITSMNEKNIELVDTILHEALHATGKPLGRHTEAPEDTKSTEYWLEELCVYSGLKYIYPIMKIPEMRSISRRNKDEHDKLINSLKSGVSEEVLNLWNEHGENAAQYLLKYIAADHEAPEELIGRSSV